MISNNLQPIWEQPTNPGCYPLVEESPISSSSNSHSVNAEEFPSPTAEVKSPEESSSMKELNPEEESSSVEKSIPEEDVMQDNVVLGGGLLPTVALGGIINENNSGFDAGGSATVAVGGGASGGINSLVLNGVASETVMEDGLLTWQPPFYKCRLILKNKNIADSTMTNERRMSAGALTKEHHLSRNGAGPRGSTKKDGVGKYNWGTENEIEYLEELEVERTASESKVDNSQEMGSKVKTASPKDFERAKMAVSS
ncbi:hypothetical protein H4R24_003484 [Coemansia sp. RSA 988]|nr:hypothetical protein H4R24_003484 [Coemansia sp. RSA 988]